MTKAGKYRRLPITLEGEARQQAMPRSMAAPADQSDRIPGTETRPALYRRPATTSTIKPPQRSHRPSELDLPMLQFDAAPVVTSIPFFVNGEEFYSRGRKLARPYARQGCSAWCGIARSVRSIPRSPCEDSNRQNKRYSDSGEPSKAAFLILTIPHAGSPCFRLSWRTASGHRRRC
jgi:hypothetical protein